MLHTTGVNKDNDGNITSLDLKNGLKHESDFYIDCTGFASIIKKAKRVELLGEGRLFTNTAVAGHVPYKDKEKECVPYVSCPAVDHGWIWKIPTQSRFGSGMVFNKDITDIDTAKQYFCDHWEGRIKPEDLKVIDWVPYYSENFWEKNVVSIGLSGGFIEPLESTGLASMTTGVQKLAARIPQYAYSERDIKGYNEEMGYWYEDAVDFINSHYADTKWDTPFWNFVKETHVKSDKHLWYEAWVKVGTADWVKSWPTVTGTAANPTLVATEGIAINGTTVSLGVGETTVAQFAAKVNAAGITGVTASVVDGKINLFGDGSNTVDGSTDDDGAIRLAAGGSGTLLADLGLTAGDYYSSI